VLDVQATTLGHRAYNILVNLTVHVEVALSFENSSAHPLMATNLNSIHVYMHSVVLCSITMFLSKPTTLPQHTSAVPILGEDGIQALCNQTRAARDEARELHFSTEARRHQAFDYKVLLAVQRIAGQLAMQFERVHS